MPFGESEERSLARARHAPVTQKRRSVPDCTRSPFTFPHAHLAAAAGAKVSRNLKDEKRAHAKRKAYRALFACRGLKTCDEPRKHVPRFYLQALSRETSKAAARLVARAAQLRG